MSTYDSQYYFIRFPSNKEGIPSLLADHNTVNRRFEYEQQDEGSPPLVFHNGMKNEYLAAGTSIAKPHDILFDGTNIVVTTDIHRELLTFNTPDMYTHPTVYIHDDGEWYEDYWYITFEKRFDCWDRENSDYDPEPDGFGDFIYYEVDQFSLNSELLDNTPLNQRLLFKMGGASDAFVTCHESIKHLFDNDGTTLIAVNDW